MSFANIPLELKTINAWCVWRYEEAGVKPTKVPYCSPTKHMNVNEPATWLAFDIAVDLCRESKFDGIGFVFHDGCGYSFIDLDDTKGDQIALNRQIEIYREFDSWSEISPSGKGLHIIVRGVVPAGRRRSFIEIYSSQRYATFTGNIYNNKPIQNRQEQLTRLWQQMGDGPVAMTMYHDQPEIENDNGIHTRASEAVNGGTYKKLYAGQWHNEYPSQSEADLALINIISFYTKNREQIKRIYWNSVLGNTDKKRKRPDYVEGMILKSFDRDLPPIDFDGFRNQLELKLMEGKKQAIVIEPTLPGITPVAQLVVPAAHNGSYDGSSPSGSTIPIPPGLLGELAQFIYSAAPLPVPEIALAGAIGLMAGICGRAYNINGEGLNQYILLIAQSGTGKEAMASGIDKLIDGIKLYCPTSNRIVGPAEITSGEALVRYINKPFNQCFVSILSEFGYRLQVLSDKRNFAQTTLKKMLLDLYHKSGKGRVFKAKIFSDKDKDIGETQSPAFSILAETTPGIFYECITEEIIADGFLPRFILIEYKGPRVSLNENRALLPSVDLAQKLASFFAHCETLMHQQKVVDIQFATPEAEKQLKKFSVYATDMINKNAREDIRQLWNRAHIKAWKLAGLIAVGVNAFDPVITLENIEWALSIISNDIKALSTKFESGEIGSNSLEIKQDKDLTNVIREYLISEFEHTKTYSLEKNDILHKERIIPWGYISRRLRSFASFRNDRIGATSALKRAIASLIDGDKLRELTTLDKKQFNTTQRCFVISNPAAFV